MSAARWKPIHKGCRDGNSKRVKDHHSFTDQLRCRNQAWLRTSIAFRIFTEIHVIESKASVKDGKIAEYRVTIEMTFVLGG
jgi:hypothetical protein